MGKIERKTHIIDASGKSLGRLANQAADLLRGKNKPSYLPYLDQGDCVTIINTDKIKFTGQKIKQKKYYKHSGYLGHLKITKLENLLKRDSREVIRRAVYGMMPANKLRAKMLKRLKCYAKEK